MNNGLFVEIVSDVSATEQMNASSTSTILHLENQDVSLPAAHHSQTVPIRVYQRVFALEVQGHPVYYRTVVVLWSFVSFTTTRR